MVYCVKKPFLKCGGHMNSLTLVGTICYYPNNSDFYFFGSNTFDVDVFSDSSGKPESISNRNMVFKIICTLCGIEEGSTQGNQLRAACDDHSGIFINTTKKIDGGNTRLGIIKFVNNIRYCLRLDTSKLFGKPTLQYIKFSQDHYDAKTYQPIVYDDDDVSGSEEAEHIDAWDDKPVFKMIDICKLDKEPDKIPEKPDNKLLEDGDNVVLIDELKSLKDGSSIEKFGTRGLLKKHTEIFKDASKLQKVEVKLPPTEYRQCLIDNRPKKPS
jgi:hypothetical protein